MVASPDLCGFVTLAEVPNVIVVPLPPVVSTCQAPLIYASRSGVVLLYRIMPFDAVGLCPVVPTGSAMASVLWLMSSDTPGMVVPMPMLPPDVMASARPHIVPLQTSSSPGLLLPIRESVPAVEQAAPTDWALARNDAKPKTSTMRQAALFIEQRKTMNKRNLC